MLHANTPSPDLFWRKQWPKWGGGGAPPGGAMPSHGHPLKRTRAKSKPNHVIQLNCRKVCTYANCETSSNIGVALTPPRSIKNASPFRRTMAVYIDSFKPIKKKKKRLTLHWFFLLSQRKNLIKYQNQKNVFSFLWLWLLLL